MKVSMMSYTMARGVRREDFDVVGLCAFAVELGLDAIDWVTTYGRDAAELRRVTEDHGLATCCHTFMCDLNFASAADREPGREAFRQGIADAVALGTDKIMLPIGGKPEFSRDESFRNVMTGLAEVIDVADEAGVAATVEHFPLATSPFVTSDDLNRAIAELPQLRITFDNGNAASGGETPGEAFTRSAEHVVHAHFKDFVVCPADAPGARLGLDGVYRMGELVGDGMVDQLGSVAAMKAAGYTGYVNFEYEGSALTPREATIEGVRRMQEWF